MSNVGSIVFGPRTTEEQREFYERHRHAFQTVQGEAIGHLCNCIGPQPGETKCPCALRAESQMGARMVRDGVTINGVHYDLVPSKKP